MPSLSSVRQATTTNNEPLVMAEPLHDLAEEDGITFGTLPDRGWLGTVQDHELLARHANLLVWHLDWISPPTFAPSTMPTTSIS